MAKITLQQAIQYAQAAGFKGQSLITVLAIAMAESGLNTTARYTNTGGSVDRGILQINNYWHAEYSDAQCDNPATAFKAGYTISSSGTNFNPWSTYTSGKYKQYIPVVTAAVQGDQQNASGPSAATIAAVNAAMNATFTVKNAWSLASNASVSQALVSFDEVFAVNNPFDIDTSGMQDSILGVNVTDPVKWLAQLGSNLVGDLVAVTLRIVCISLGVFMLYKVVDHFINFSGAVQGTISTVSKLAPMIAGA